MRNLLAGAEERIFFKDRDSRFLFVSASWLAGVAPGRELEEIIGQTDFDIFSRPHALTAFEDEQRIMKTLEPIVDQVERETFHDRADAWVSTTKLPLLDDSGLVIGTFGISRDVTEQVEVQNALSYRTRHDMLTGLANRATLLERLSQDLAALDGHRGRLAVLFLDLDDFKSVNDTLGHDAGDRLLREIARRLRRISRDGDTVARVGGDQFAVVCSALPDGDVLAGISDRVMRAVCAPLRDGINELTVTGSLGAIGTGDQSADPARLLQNADTAMQAAKRRGGNRFELYSPALRRFSHSSRGLAGELQQAIEAGDVFVVYQPVLSLHDGAVWGVEALARWQHPDRGVLAPGEFIPVAERRGLIAAIGRRVLNEACRQLATWTRADACPAQLMIGVNLSGDELRDPALVSHVAATLRHHGIAPHRLCLEITENVLIGELGDARRAIEALSELGVQIALDDFGTGYSTLAHLRQLRADILKIDRSFVSQLAGQGRDHEIIAAVIGMAHALGMSVVAEGVETETQRDELNALGCDFAQGFLFARPLPAGEFVWDSCTASPTAAPSTFPDQSSIRRA